MMTHLVEDRSLQQVADVWFWLVRRRSILGKPGGNLVPRQPVSDLSVAYEQQDISLIARSFWRKLDGENQTRVVGEIVGLERKRLGGVKPIKVDPPPVAYLIAIRLENRIPTWMIGDGHLDRLEWHSNGPVERKG